MNLAQQIADRAALAFHNARIFEGLQRANRARDDFLAIVSHDLRNPLGAMILNAGLLARSAKEEAVRRGAEAIIHSGKAIDSLLGDLLDVASLDAGRLRVEPDDHVVGGLVAEAVEALEPLAAARSIKLESAVKDPEARVSCDRARIIQVFWNLVGNAIKFTPEGGTIRLAAEVLGAQVRFSVRDTGPGIRPEHIPLVFERYWQAKATPHRAGVGLGLYITKAIVELHGGHIWVESTLGSGSTFFFTLAARPAAAPEARAA
jgi:signal transduction histidine kinase